MSKERYWWCLGFWACLYLMRGDYERYDELRDEYLALPESD